MKTALLLIDMQNDYFLEGRMELSNAIQASIQAQKVLYQFRKTYQLVVHIQYIANREWGTFFLSNTEGIEFQKNVAPMEKETIITKHFPNSFRETALLQ